MMRRSLLLLGSALVMILLVGGGVFLRVGAAENPYRQAVLFAEVLAQVLDNYVDPVDPGVLLEGAYEGMLAGLDPNGAYLSPAEVAEWKRSPEADRAGAGFSVLKRGHTLQVVAVDPGSSAETAGVQIGDHVRSIDGSLVRDLSLEQARRRIAGEPGTVVTVEVLHPADGFRRELVELVRQARRGRAYELRVEEGWAILVLSDLRRLDFAALGEELDDVRSRGVERLLVDLRYVSEGDPRDAARVAAVFHSQLRLQLRDRSGRLLDSVETAPGKPAWNGELAVLVNGATAGGAEALALLLRDGRQARIYGEATYGLGAETKLYELEDGAGVLVASALWETAAGHGWNGNGVQPDEVIEGQGEDHAASSADQLRQVLERLRARPQDDTEEGLREAA